MNSPKKNILITGPPGVGKTTLIKKVSEKLKDLCPVGFYTSEIREKGTRKGFELISFDGRRVTLAHADMKGPVSVGKYGVDIGGFEELLKSIPFLKPQGSLIIVDEIGKMECLSHKFTGLIKNILDSQKRVIAAVALKGGGTIEEVKERDDITLIEITRDNRGSVAADILKMVQRQADPLLWSVAE